MSKLGIREKLCILEWNLCILTTGTEDSTPKGEIAFNGTLAFDGGLLEFPAEGEIELLAFEDLYNVSFSDE